MEQQGLWERAERLRGAVDEAARLARNVYLSFLLLGTYIAIIIGSTTDMQLLKGSPVTLPLLNVQLPIVGFYAMVPWLLWLLYFNLLLHFTFLARPLHRLSAMLTAFPEKSTREELRLRLFPFPFSTRVLGGLAQWRLRALLGLMIWITVVFFPLALLLGTQVRFLPYHNTAITWNHRVAVLADIALLWFFRPWLLVPEQYAVGFIAWIRRSIFMTCLTLVAVVFSLGIAVLPEEALERWIASMASYLPRALVQAVPGPPWMPAGLDSTTKPVFWPTYWLFERPGAPFYRNLRLQERDLVAGDPQRKSSLHYAARTRTGGGKALKRLRVSASPIVICAVPFSATYS
jgi:hypothetical protein